MVRRSWWAAVALCCLAIVAGCATLAPEGRRNASEGRIERNPLEVPGAPQVLAVVPARYAPDSNFVTYARGAAEGAVKGGVAGGAQGALLLGHLWPLLFIPAGWGILAGFAGAGLVAGAAIAVPVDQAAAIEQMVNSAIAELRLPELAAKTVAANVAQFAPYRTEIVDGLGPESKDDTPDYRALRERGFGGVLEVRLNRIGFAGSGGADPEIVLFVVAEARLVDPATGRPTAARGLYVESPRHRASVWVSEAGALVKSAARQALAATAERAVDDLVLQTDVWIGRDALSAPVGCGLAPQVPRPEWEARLFERKHLVPAAVESRMPRLVWDGRPPPEGARGRAFWVRTSPEAFVYDLRIWNAFDGAPGEIVYERMGLPRPEHRVETELAPGSTYFWSVRARFAIDGHPRALRWNASNEPRFVPAIPVGRTLYYSAADDAATTGTPCGEPALIPCGCLDFIPTANYYRFRTP